MIVNANFGVFEIIALINIFVRDAGGTGGNMASYFGRQQSVASMASLPPDEVEFELDLEVRHIWVISSFYCWIIRNTISIMCLFFSWYQIIL